MGRKRDYSEVVNLIPFGQENAIERFELKELAGMSDRDVRSCIQAAREDGILIVNVQNGNGYFRVTPDDLKDIEIQYRLNESRMKSLSKQQKPLRAILKAGGKL